MKKHIQVIFFIFTFLFSASLLYCVELSLKISGGLSYMKMENVNRVLQDWTVFKKKWADSQEFWSYSKGEISPFHSAFDFEGEVIFSFTPHLAISVGSGFLYGELGEEETGITMKDEINGNFFLDVRPTKVNAFPVFFTGYYMLSFKKIGFYIKGGAGLIWAKHVERLGSKLMTAKDFRYFSVQSSSARGSLILGGIGITYELENSMDFFIEGSARMSRVQGFHGENEEGISGTLFTFEVYNPDLEFWQVHNLILPKEPSGENIRSVQETTVDFSGLSIKIGLIIKF